MNSGANSAFTLRPAQRGDAAAVGDLWLALHREHEAMDDRYVLADDAAQRWRNDFLVWVDDRTHRLMLGCAGDEIVGFIHAYRHVDAPIYALAPEVYIDEIYVTPAHRRCGLGAALLASVREWGIEHGAEWIRLHTLAANEAGRRFWEKHGGRALSVVYTIPLESERRSPEKDPPRRIGF